MSRQTSLAPTYDAPSDRVTRRRVSGFALWSMLVVLVAAAYHPAWFGGVLWDDDAHLTRPELRTWAGLARIWFELGATQQYYPLVHSTFWLGARLWGDHVLGYHLLNIALHATSAYLVIVVLDRIGARGAVLAGVLFAIHPVEVESVAWMTELKNTLSGALYLCAALVYVDFDRRRQWRLYALALGLFVLALLSKSVTATLPVALLIVFWWQRGALQVRRDVLPLVPWLAVGVASGLLTAWVEHTYIGAHGDEFGFSFVERTLIAGRAWMFYLRSIVWPADLMFIYPRWQIDATDWRAYLFPIAAAVLVLSAWLVRARTRAPLAALLFFSVTLAPALGFVNVYPFRFSFVADHFQYLAGLGVMALLAAVLHGGAARLSASSSRFALATLPVVGGLILMPLTWRQSRDYVDPGTLYRETLSRNPRAWLAELNLGVLEPHDQEGIGRAIRHFEAALAIYPNEAQINNNLGTSWMEFGRDDLALRFHREAVRLAPGYAEAYWNLGVDLQHAGQLEEAIASYRTALRLKRGLPPAVHYDLAVALHLLGRDSEARVEADTSFTLDPTHAASAELRRKLTVAAGSAIPGQPSPDGAVSPSPSARTWITAGNASIAAKRWPDAEDQMRRALALEPNSGEARRGLAAVLWQAARADEAEQEIRRVLRADGSDAASHDLLGSILLSQRRTAEAVDEYRRALTVDRGALRPDILNDLGVALAQQGQIGQARDAFQEALQLRPAFAAARANLARASGFQPAR